MTLKLTILQSLSRRGGIPMAEHHLVNECRLGLPDQDKPTAGDVAAAVRELESEGAVAGTNNIDLGTRWVITDQGTLRLREAGL